MIPVRGPVHVDPPQGQQLTQGSAIVPLVEVIEIGGESPELAFGKEAETLVAPAAATENPPAGIRFRRDRRTEKMLLELLLENVADGEVTVDKALEFFIQE